MTAHQHVPRLDRYNHLICHCGKILVWNNGLKYMINMEGPVYDKAIIEKHMNQST